MSASKGIILQCFFLCLILYLQLIFPSGPGIDPTINHCYTVAAIKTIYLRTLQHVMGSQKKITINNDNEIVQFNKGNRRRFRSEINFNLEMLRSFIL